MDKKNVLVLLAQGLPHDILGYRIGVKGRGRRETGDGGTYWSSHKRVLFCHGRCQLEVMRLIAQLR